MKNIILALLLALTTLAACGTQTAESPSSTLPSCNACSSLTTHTPASAPRR
jgi:hypothetical protein